jgi:hypothetical protein
MMHDLQVVSKRVNEASNRLTRHYALEEEKLRTANLGVEAWVPFRKNYEIGYAKCNGNWQLAVRHSEQFVFPLCNESRVIRMLGIKALPDIEAALCVEAEMLAKQLEAELGVK